jgi:hypothetical protein
MPRPYPSCAGMPGAPTVCSRCFCISGVSSFPVANAGTQVCMSSRVEIMAPAAHPQVGSQLVAVVSLPSAVVSVYPCACGSGKALSVGKLVWLMPNGVKMWSRMYSCSG